MPIANAIGITTSNYKDEILLFLIALQMNHDNMVDIR